MRGGRVHGVVEILSPQWHQQMMRHRLLCMEVSYSVRRFIPAVPGSPQHPSAIVCVIIFIIRPAGAHHSMTSASFPSSSVPRQRRRRNPPTSSITRLTAHWKGINCSRESLTAGERRVLSCLPMYNRNVHIYSLPKFASAASSERFSWTSNSIE